MYFIGATGLLCSVKAKDSWRSLLHTMVVGYLGGLVLYTILSPFIFIVAGLLLLVLVLVDIGLGTSFATMCVRNLPYFLHVFFISSCISLVIIFWALAVLFMQRTVRHIADRERTRHWYDEPLYRRSRRPELDVRRF
jgi:hypothetical protein